MSFLKLLKLIKKYRKRFMIIAATAVLIAFVWTMLIPIIGIYQVKITFIDMFKRENPESSIEIAADISTEDLETMIDEMQEDIFKNSSYPISLEDMKKALKEERKTYSKKIFKHNIQNVKIKSGTNISSNKQIKITEKEVNLKDIEYEYRLPWQIINAVDFYLIEDKMESTVRALLSTYTYEYPENIKFSFHDNQNSVDNHKININKASTVPYDDRRHEFYDIGLRGIENASRYDSIEEEKIVIERKNYTKTEEGWRHTGTTKKVEKDIKKVEPSIKIKQVVTPFKKISYKYKRDQVLDELIDQEKYTNKSYDNNGKAVSKTVTTINKYRSHDKIELKEVVEVDNSIVFTEFLDTIGIGKENADDFREIVSLYPGGYYVAAGIVGDHINAHLDDHLKIVSELDNPSFGFIGNIIIEPSELLLPIPRFSQIDARWARIRYGDSTIGRGGCGPTVASMVITGLTKEIVTPVDAARISVENGCKVKAGTSWNFYRIIADKYNITTNQYTPRNYQKVLDELRKGNPAIASMGPGHFTSRGHFIVLAGIDKDGKVIVNDPYDPFDIKNKSWDFRVVLNESKQFWTFEK